jgi:hypothetical protein
MMSRCYSPKNHAYPRYGGAGVRVADEWLRFEGFYRDMGERPKGTTLDRLDPDGGYTADNTRWATIEEQNGHLRTCRMIEHQGKTQNVAAWARELGISYNRAYDWLVDQHLTPGTVRDRPKSQNLSILRPA